MVKIQLRRPTVAIVAALGLNLGPLPALASAQPVSLPPAPDALFQQAQAIEEQLERAGTDTQRENLLLALAKVYRDLRRYDRAAECYERIRSMEAFAASPNRQTVLYQLGFLYETQGQYESAVNAYLEYVSPAIEDASPEEEMALPAPVTPTDFQVQRRLVEVLTEAGRSAEAKRMLFNLAAQDDDRQSVYALTRLVRMYEQGFLADRELGAIADPLLDQLPREAAELAGILAQRRRTAAARYFYDELLRRNQAALLPFAEGVADFYRREEALPVAVKELQQADPSMDVVRLLVRLYRWSGELDKAITLVESRLSEGEPPDLYRDLGELRMAARDYASAATAYQELIRGTQMPDSDMYRALGEAYLLGGDEARAIESWSRIPAILGNSPRAYQVVAEILDQHGFGERAVEMMEEAVKRSPQSAATMPYLVNLYLKNGRYEDAINQLIRLPGSFVGLDRMMMDSILKAATSREVETRLLQAAETALAEAPTEGVDVLLDIIFQVHLRSGDFDAAIEQVRRVPGAVGEQRLFVLGQTLHDFGELQAAAKAYTAIPPSSPYGTAARIEAVQVLIEAGEFDRALELAAETLGDLTGSAAARAAVSDGSSELFAVLSGVIRSGTDWGAGRRSDVENLLLALGDLRIRQKNGRDALAVVVLARQIPTRGRGVSSRNLLRGTVLAGHAYALLGDHRNARIMYETASEWPGPVQDEARFMLAELSLWDGDTEAARTAYEELLEQDLSRTIANDLLERLYFLSQLNPDETVIYAAGHRFAWQGRWDEAIDRFRTLSARRPADHISDWCLFNIGRIQLARGEPDAARAEWERLLAKTEDISLKGRIRLGLVESEAEVEGASPEAILEGYRGIIEDMPETIFADEARRRMTGS